MRADQPPKHLHLDRSRGLTVEWSSGETSFYPVGWLRRMSPSADQRELRAEMERNPLTILPTPQNSEPLRADALEFVGNYAVRIRFSDGHDTGIYSWEYLRDIEPKDDIE